MAKIASFLRVCFACALSLVLYFIVFVASFLVVAWIETIILSVDVLRGIVSVLSSLLGDSPLLGSGAILVCSSLAAITANLFFSWMTKSSGKKGVAIGRFSCIAVMCVILGINISINGGFSLDRFLLTLAILFPFVACFRKNLFD